MKKRCETRFFGTGILSSLVLMGRGSKCSNLSGDICKQFIVSTFELLGVLVAGFLVAGDASVEVGSVHQMERLDGWWCREDSLKSSKIVEQRGQIAH